ncbi:MAG: phosphatase domain-containing protein [Brooklawnia sp.]|uniref:App1 family protein n=1 Tax=Brooklawnia sp. TaxID=2699740 RepID=UPI003C74FF0F
MKSRQFVGVRIDDFVTRHVVRALRRRGWREAIVPFTGYGTDEHVRVLGRLTLRPSKPKTYLGMYTETFLQRRGWRNFVTAPVPRRPVTVKVGDDELELVTDAGGYIDVNVRTSASMHGLKYVTISTDEAPPTRAPVRVVDSAQEFGLISDIDDTILSTWIPRLFLAVWNSFFLTEGNRLAVPGMARLYQRLLAEHPGAPIIYVSTGSWNTLPFLNRFMKRHGFPRGPMLLTDFGPTQTRWFRSGREHKSRALAELARDFPNIKWLLIGDDGQHDPAIYREFAELRPGHVRAIAIRQLSATEQMLAHGTVAVLKDSAELRWEPPVVPEVTGADGDELAAELKRVLRSRPGDRSG